MQLKQKSKETRFSWKVALGCRLRRSVMGTGRKKQLRVKVRWHVTRCVLQRHGSGRLRRQEVPAGGRGFCYVCARIGLHCNGVDGCGTVFLRNATTVQS